MKKRTFAMLTLTTLLTSAVICLVGCGTFGANPSPPTKVETAIYDVVTNFVPTTVYKTNTVVITQMSTNQLVVTQTITNQLGVVAYNTNIINIPVFNYTTNQVAEAVQTNLPAYSYTVKPSTTAVNTGIGALLDAVIPGGGTLASLGLAAIIGIWGRLRTTKQVGVSIGLSQEIETVLEFVKALPNGAVYNDALQKWMAEHQGDLNIVTQVATILGNEISNPDAKVAAQSVVESINGLKATATPLAAVSIKS